MIGDQTIDRVNALFTDNIVNNNDDDDGLLDKDQYYICKINDLIKYDLSKNDIKFNMIEEEQKYFDIIQLFEIKDENDLCNFYVQNNVLLNMIIHLLYVNKCIEFTPYQNYNILNKIEIKKEKKEEIIVKKSKKFSYEHLLEVLNKLVSLIYPYLDYFCFAYKNIVVKKFDKVNTEINFEMSLSSDNKNLSFRFTNNCHDLVVQSCCSDFDCFDRTVLIQSISKEYYQSCFNKYCKRLNKNEIKNNSIKIKNDLFEIKCDDESKNENKNKNKKFLYNRCSSKNNNYFKNKKQRKSYKNENYYYPNSKLNKNTNEHEKTKISQNDKQNIHEISNLDDVLDHNDLIDILKE